MLLGFGAPHKPLLLVGREHGRTIPLADIDRFTAALIPNTDGNRIAPLLPWQGSGLPWTKRKYGWVLI
jgi:hypothetical protein